MRPHHILNEMLIGCVFALLANCEFIAYLCVILYATVEATVLTLPLPLLTFLWGTLSPTGPSKAYWVVMILYTQMLLLLKNIGQLHDQRMLEIYKIVDIQLERMALDCFLLSAMFLFRMVHRNIGLWNRDRDEPLVTGVYTVDAGVDWMQFGAPEVVTLEDLKEEEEVKQQLGGTSKRQRRGAKRRRLPYEYDAEGALEESDSPGGWQTALLEFKMSNG